MELEYAKNHGKRILFEDETTKEQYTMTITSVNKKKCRLDFDHAEVRIVFHALYNLESGEHEGLEFLRDHMCAVQDLMYIGNLVHTMSNISARTKKEMAQRNERNTWNQ